MAVDFDSQSEHGYSNDEAYEVSDGDVSIVPVRVVDAAARPTGKAAAHVSRGRRHDEPTLSVSKLSVLRVNGRLTDFFFFLPMLGQSSSNTEARRSKKPGSRTQHDTGQTVSPRTVSCTCVVPVLCTGFIRRKS